MAAPEKLIRVRGCGTSMHANKNVRAAGACNYYGGAITPETTCHAPPHTCGSAMRATPPSLLMSAGTFSKAMTAHAPASSAILACSAFTTSMMIPPFSICASPLFTTKVPVLGPGSSPTPSVAAVIVDMAVAGCTLSITIPHSCHSAVQKPDCKGST